MPPVNAKNRRPKPGFKDKVHRHPAAATRVELWVEGQKTPHVRVHSNGACTFNEVKRYLILMRDKLSDEIERGTEMCPYAPAKVRRKGRPP